MEVSFNNVLASKFSFHDAMEKSLELKHEVAELHQAQCIMSRMHDDAKIHSPWMINDCNYVASMSKHNYRYELK